MVFQRLNGGQKRITLRDVIVQMQNTSQRLFTELRNVEQRLSAKIEANTLGIQQNTVHIKENTEAIEFLTRRVDALDEDLTATIKDTLRIRAHVGMPLPDQE